MTTQAEITTTELIWRLLELEKRVAELEIENEKLQDRVRFLTFK